MADGSIAPKERVNIVYKPATGDVREDVELPLKYMVLGDFTGKEDVRTLEDRVPVSVDKDNFNDVMKGLGLNLDLAVPNRFGDDPEAMMNVSLSFERISDFGPDAIVSQVPELARLIELREALKSLKGPLSNTPSFRKKIQEIVTDEQARAAILKELGLEEETRSQQSSKTGTNV